MHCTQLPVCCQYKRFHAGMGTQPVVNELVNAGIIGADMGFGELPNPVGGGINCGCDHTL
ncbi:hypothetical protein GCM10023322_84460 [Rugosimonospora acidiphila]|uniref:Uncharacterized protein n=1 Tax=Rugosimonospora acidiphila TaxID=556531 RepID=A0ABP9SW03_9ACTN